MDRINDGLKLFQEDIQNYLNSYFANNTYSYTDAGNDEYTPCKLKDEEDRNN